jgi:hypothetical protein
MLKSDYICYPHSVFVCFVWISEQTVIISLYSINWLVFITEKECVYCAVRTESLYAIQINLSILREYFGFVQSVPLHQCSILIFTYALFLSQG